MKKQLCVLANRLYFFKNKVYYTTIALFMGVIVVSCKKDLLTKVNERVSDRPTQEVYDLNVIQTERGVLKLEMRTKLLRGYQLADTPYFDFPKGIFICSFKDSLPEIDMVADSARFWQNPRSFMAKGNVVVRNLVDNMRMETEGPLYWDSQKKIIYTNEPAVIFRPTDTIPALNGVTIDDDFKSYELRKGRDGVVYIDVSSKDSIQSEDQH